MKEGIIYCVRNPLFPHIVKIGITTKETVEDRGLDASNIPENFEIIWAYKVSDIVTAENGVHNHVEQYKYKSKSGRDTEFFYELAIDQAEKCAVKVFKGIDAIKSIIKINKTVVIDDDKYEPDPKYNDFVNWEDLRLMRSENDKFRTEEDAKAGWIRATNPWRMNIVRAAKKAGAWKDAKISLAWLKSEGYYDKLMSIDWDDY